MNDLRFAFRQLARKPGFTAMVVLTLGLGIGATTAIFSVVNAALLRPLPFRNPDQLVRLYTEFPNFPNGGLRRFAFSPPEFFDFRRDTKSWESVNAYVTTGVNLLGDADPLRVRGCMMTGELFQQLGVSPLLGRWIMPSDDVPGAERAAVISYGLWQRAFGGKTNVLGREFLAEADKAIVVGVMPKDFTFPMGELAETEVWGALRLDPAAQNNRGGHFLNVLGSLKAGVTLAQAQEEIRLMVKRSTETAPPNSHEFHAEFHPVVSYGLHDEIVREVRPALKMLFGAVCFVLLIACVNVGNLLLARAEHRQREIAIRSAIGAGFWRLVRQFVTEGVALSLLGAALGLFLAYHGLEFVKSSSQESLPRASEIRFDLNVGLFTIGLSLLTGVLFGLTPIAHVLRGKEYLALKSAAASSTGTGGAHRFQMGLVVAEMALALMLLVGAGLMLRAFWNLRRVDVGFNPANVMTATLSLPRNMPDDESTKAWLRLDERLRALPGVESIGLVTGLPPVYDSVFNDTGIEGYEQKPGSRPQNVEFYQVVSPGYFPAMQMRLVDGRFIRDTDGLETPDVCVVNQTMARAFWGNKSPVGRRIRPNNDGPWCTIVGVVEDAKNGGLDRPAGTEVYLPFNQRQAYTWRTRSIVARSRGDLNVLAQTIRKEVQAVMPGVPVTRIRTMDQVVAASRSRPRFLAQLLGVFSLTALILASVGIYGVISYSVAQRTREFGVRMALGARTIDVLKLVLSRGVFLTLLGLFIGLVGSVALTRFLSSLLFGVTPTDPITFVIVPLVLAGVAFMASYFPARRATRVDPLEALRYE